MEEHLLVLADDVRQVWDQLFAIADQRIVFGVLRRLELRAEHHRADFERRLLQLRHGHGRLERSDQSARVLANDDLHGEAPWRKRHGRLIKDLP